jgi:hypothetical protein
MDKGHSVETTVEGEKFIFNAWSIAATSDAG